MQRVAWLGGAKLQCSCPLNAWTSDGLLVTGRQGILLAMLEEDPPPGPHSLQASMAAEAPPTSDLLSSASCFVGSTYPFKQMRNLFPSLAALWLIL